MKLYTFNQEHFVEGLAQLRQLLRSSRNGPHGAFLLSHDDQGPALWLSFNNQFAHAHYFKDQRYEEPGFQSMKRTPPGCPESVIFQQTESVGGHTHEIDQYFVCSPDDAYAIAEEFFASPQLPTCIEWDAL